MGSRRGSIRRLPSGSFQIRYVGLDGRRYAETIGPDEKQAERALTARLRELDTGQWREPSRLTVAEYAEKWLARRRGRIASSTHAEYGRSLKLYVLPIIGAVPLASLRPGDVDGMVAELEQEGPRRETNRRPLASGTVRGAMTPLRRMLRDAVRDGLIVSNPAVGAELPPQREFAGRELPDDHIGRLRAALVELAPDDPFRPGERDLFAVWWFDVALGLGLRFGELRALRWRDVDRGRRLVRVEWAYSRSELKRPKTDAGIRSVPLFPTVDAALQALAARALDRGRYAPDELVFACEHGGPMWGSNFNRRVWQPALEKAKLGEYVKDEQGRRRWRGMYRPHDLRHSSVSRLVAAGVDVKLAQAVAGHSNPMITLKRYAHLSDERVSEAALRFDPGARTGHAAR